MTADEARDARAFLQHMGCENAIAVAITVGRPAERLTFHTAFKRPADLKQFIVDFGLASGPDVDITTLD